MRLNIVLSATGLIAGATASALTYTALATTATAAAATTRIGTHVTATALGAGIRLLVGPTTGELVAATLQTIGTTTIAPAIQSSGNTIALVTSAAVGALVVTAVSLLGHGAVYTYKAAIRLLKGKQPAIAVDARIVDDQALDCWVIETLSPA
jgi:hypothetical protein